MKERSLEMEQVENNKSLTTKNAQRVTFDFDDPSSYPLQPAGRIIIPNHESTKWSVKDNGIVKAYAANTNQGIIRDYNEDRVSIILNILKPQSRENEDWPRCSFFGVYDGHGGAGCADYLRDSLHQFVIREPSFPWNPKEAIKEGFMKAEKKFMENNYVPDQGIIDKSGSCAIVVLIVGDLWFVANVGDSRAVLSGDGGKKIFPLSLDHKPCDDIERKRIIDAGGQIYQTAIPKNLDLDQEFGPHRVLPGRLSVSRTFGDLEAKIKQLGGNPNVVIAEPDIKAFRVTDAHDFIVMGSDGIFDKISNRECIQCMWNSLRDERTKDVHQQTGKGVEWVIKNSLFRKSLDNVTIVIITFENFERIFSKEERKTSDSTTLSNDKSSRTESHHQNLSNYKKRPTLTKTFNSKPIGLKEAPKHRRVDSGGKKAQEKVLEHINTRKRTNSQTESRNRSPNKDEKLSSSDISKGKQTSYSNFNRHFNYTTEVPKAKITPKAIGQTYKRLIPPSKWLTTKNQEVKKKKFNFEL